MLLLPDGRKVYKRPDSDDLTLYAQAAADWETARLAGAPYPKQEIPPGNNTDQARGYNYRFWYQMFNARQLLCLSSLLEAIVHEPDRPIREQLLLLFSGILEFNNLFCSFKGEGTGAVRPLFSHHIIKPERTPLEANVWGTPKSSGSFSTLFERRLLAAQAYAADPFELKVMDDNGRAAGRKVYRINRSLAVRLADAFDEVATGAADALILSGDSASLPLPDGCVDAVVTDPPYFDNVHYSELADFFHVWLRLAFDGNDSAFSAASTRHPNEVQDTDPSAFEKGLGAVLAECRRVLKPDGMVTFTFQHARMEAWLALVNALEHARLRVVATHPIKAEMSVATPKSQAKEPINLDVVFVCRPVSQMADHTFVLPTVDDLLGRVREYVLRLTTAGLTLSRGDLFVIAMSQFVTQCQSANDLDGVYRRAFSDEQAAILAELGVALERLSPDELIARREARQLRLLDEPALYTVPETAGYAIS
jgi:adenine-specific DNA methylase